MIVRRKHISTADLSLKSSSCLCPNREGVAALHECLQRLDGCKLIPLASGPMDHVCDIGACQCGGCHFGGD